MKAFPKIHNLVVLADRSAVADRGGVILPTILPLGLEPRAHFELQAMRERDIPQVEEAV